MIPQQALNFGATYTSSYPECLAPFAFSFIAEKLRKKCVGAATALPGRLHSLTTATSNSNTETKTYPTKPMLFWKATVEMLLTPFQSLFHSKSVQFPWEAAYSIINLTLKIPDSA